jgi:hypothetical protein
MLDTVTAHYDITWILVALFVSAILYGGDAYVKLRSINRDIQSRNKVNHLTRYSRIKA